MSTSIGGEAPHSNKKLDYQLVAFEVFHKQPQNLSQLFEIIDSASGSLTQVERTAIMMRIIEDFNIKFKDK